MSIQENNIFIFIMHVIMWFIIIIGATTILALLCMLMDYLLTYIGKQIWGWRVFIQLLVDKNDEMRAKKTTNRK